MRIVSGVITILYVKYREDKISSELSEPWFIETKSGKDEDVMIHLYSSSYGNTESVLSL